MFQPQVSQCFCEAVAGGASTQASQVGNTGGEGSSWAGCCQWKFLPMVDPQEGFSVLIQIDVRILPKLIKRPVSHLSKPESPKLKSKIDYVIYIYIYIYIYVCIDVSKPPKLGHIPNLMFWIR